MAEDHPVEPAADLLSIGDLAEATGLSPHTLRVWERRYGRPEPVRLPSGHRRYTPEQARWLRLVGEALALGERPGRVLGLGEGELRRLLEERAGALDEGETARLLEFAVAFDAEGLRAWLRRRRAELGPRVFLGSFLDALLLGLGRAWADGRAGVRHEHFVSEILEDELRVWRRSLPPGREPPLILTTLPGEAHGLGLQLAALTAGLAGRSVRLLGPDTPEEEILRAASEGPALALGLSVSLGSAGIETARAVARLRRGLPEGLPLLLGGRGGRTLRRLPRGVERVESLPELEDWLARHAGTAAGRTGS